MLRSELYRQVRHLKDWLYHVCLKSEKPWAVSTRLRGLRCSMAALTEVYLNQLRVSLPKKPRRRAASTPVAYLDGASLSPNFDEMLKMGPKFRLEPRAQSTSCWQLCIGGGLKGLKTWGNNRKGKDLRPIVAHFEKNHLRLLQADKEGAFVIMPSSAFDLKASEAIQKNFKSHKPGCPVRAIVTEDAPWQKLVSGFLQRALKGLVPNDPFAVRGSLVIVENLSRGFPSANAAFSVDIEDMFYSIQQDELLEAPLGWLLGATIPVVGSSLGGVFLLRSPMPVAHPGLSKISLLIFIPSTVTVEGISSARLSAAVFRRSTSCRYLLCSWLGLPAISYANPRRD
ncbi:hypothetical protein HPB50_004186 [Hyalomma asiaticum]|uniref:Uncharacterized protein n=1 Tax=Hyalomma asiaticum TaxID=266040 RepID=A0ACB7S0M9_HYAAI|nr:hypothetical protein HPB50_004186 [Hyalomma asiaticum]